MISGIIMASGFSSRMKRDKLLMKIDNKQIIRYVMKAAKESNLDEIIIVYRKDEIKNIGRYYDVKTVYNSEAHLGQSQSIIKGIKGARNDAYMFLAGDQPFINHRLINKLIAEHRNHKNNIIVPIYNNRISLPTIFPSNFRDDLLNIKGDKGGREIIKNNPEFVRQVNVKDGSLLIDIDTIEDYRSQSKK